MGEAGGKILPPVQRMGERGDVDGHLVAEPAADGSLVGREEVARISQTATLTAISQPTMVRGA